MIIFFPPVCLWSSGPASEGRRLQPGPAGKIPGLPEPPRAPRRPQRHVRPHAAAAAGHRGEVLRQRGLLQTLPAGQWEWAWTSANAQLYCKIGTLLASSVASRPNDVTSEQWDSLLLFRSLASSVWLRVIRFGRPHIWSESLTSSHGCITPYETCSSGEKQLVVHFKKGSDTINMCLFFWKCTRTQDLSHTYQRRCSNFYCKLWKKCIWYINYQSKVWTLLLTSSLLHFLSNIWARSM